MINLVLRKKNVFKKGLLKIDLGYVASSYIRKALRQIRLRIDKSHVIEE